MPQMQKKKTEWGHHQCMLHQGRDMQDIKIIMNEQIDGIDSFPGWFGALSGHLAVCSRVCVTFLTSARVQCSASVSKQATEHSYSSTLSAAFVLPDCAARGAVAADCLPLLVLSSCFMALSCCWHQCGVVLVALSNAHQAPLAPVQIDRHIV